MIEIGALCSRRRLPHPRHDWMIGADTRHCPGWPYPRTPAAETAQVIEAVMLAVMPGADMRQISEVVAASVDRLTVAHLIVPQLM
jgi:hypothetical protein